MLRADGKKTKLHGGGQWSVDREVTFDQCFAERLREIR
jgi:hypothetical protein